VERSSPPVAGVSELVLEVSDLESACRILLDAIEERRAGEDPRDSAANTSIEVAFRETRKERAWIERDDVDNDSSLT
jgi:hypothetical protein